MSNTSHTSSAHTTSGRAHYKVTKTVTGADGKTHTETIEMHDDDAVKVSLLHWKQMLLLLSFSHI
jgi:hypothetical protein